ncbi:hypothetical protein PRK78_000888 [Emydomyces testavorans]|uniref:Pentatricopeptide repeat-containing protein n=1 Tax=Emydomyces testavorans TaxID=2070801 RepID=A0AAF0DBG4_9EURO|nr:hypothetical protein PRK78_000888 [Emydomyces testavorans]
MVVSPESVDNRREPPNTYSQREALQPSNIHGLQKREALIYRSLRADLPPDVPLNLEAYLAAKRNLHQNYRELFDFFRRTLGYEEGTKSLMVALSNPDADMRVFGSKIYRRVSDDLGTLGVKRLLSFLEDESISNKVVFRAYRALPSPRVSFLSERSRKTLLHRLANPPRRHPTDAMRYLSLIEDMCEASLPLTPSLWTAAIVLTGKNSDKVSKNSLRSAIGVWRRMEFEGNITSNSVAFNILFDLAVKAGQFKVADRIVMEMRGRGIDFSRFGRVARIFYAGLQGDAEGVRQAYHDFVSAGEIVDTTALNCVMASLIRAERLGLAEQMYDKMKSVHEEIVRNRGDSELAARQLPSQDYLSYRKASKYLGRILGMAAFLHDKLPEHHRALQDALPLTPDAKTFHIFLSYHAYISGDLERFLTLLRDMEDTFELPPQGMVYLLLFEGFAKHGGRKKSAWNLQRLTRAWASFLRDLHDSLNQDMPRVQRRISKLIWDTRLNQESPEFGIASKDEEHESQAALDDDDDDEDDLDQYTDEGDTMDTNFSNPRPEHEEDLEENGDDDDDDDEGYHCEHGVFLGRRIIIACLRAHSACGGQRAVLRVWQQIRPLWRIESQRLKDIIAVNKALYDLLPNQRV